MSDRVTRIADLLHEAAELHHAVYRITDGDHDDWASWYADWLIDLSELPEILGTRPVRSELITELVLAAREQNDDPWEQAYARRIVERFA